MPSPAEMLQFLINFFNSGWFLLLQIIGGVISLALFTISASLIWKSGYPQRHIRHLWVAWNAGRVPTQKLVKRWAAIEDALKQERPAVWRSAIIDADQMLEELLSRMSYLGKDLDERLENINPALNPEQFPSLAEAWRAHQVRKFIDEDKKYLPTSEVAERTIEIYKRIFVETGILL